MNSACFDFVCNNDPKMNRLWSYIGDDCIMQMLLAENILAEARIEKIKISIEKLHYAVRKHFI